jgi:hypothetical protein
VQAEKDMSTRVKHCQTLHVGVDRGIVVGNDEKITVGTIKDDKVVDQRELTVELNDSVVIGGNHNKSVVGRVLQVYGGDHKRKVDGPRTFQAHLSLLLSGG